MKASEFIVHLQQMIEEHGDLPLALMEISDSGYDHNFVEIDGVEAVIELQPYEKLFDDNDKLSTVRKVFLID